MNREIMTQRLKVLQEKSLDSYERNMHEKKIKLQERDDRMKTAIQTLFDSIIRDSEEKMEIASNNGNFGTVLFECTVEKSNEDEFQNIFLLKGPMRWNKDVSFFETKGLKSVYEMVNEFFDPIHVYMKYDRVSKTHMLIASWKTNNR